MVYRVLVAVDGSEASDAALEIACALADNYEAALGLLTVMEPESVNEELLEAAQTEGMLNNGPTYAEMYATGLREARATEYGALQGVQKMAQAEKAGRLAMIVAEGITKKSEAFSREKPFKAVKTFIESGDPADAILRVAGDNRADIIIMGHDQQGRIEGLLKSSTAEKVQRSARCPVLIYCRPKKK